MSIILAGGSGQAGVPFGGRYRIINVTRSNCLYSGLRHVLVLTRNRSPVSLQRHRRDGWSPDNAELGDDITPVPPPMRSGDSWYVGTADAIYQNLYLLEPSRTDYALMLSGDHIDHMDYAALLQHRRDSGARGNDFGTLKVRGRPDGFGPFHRSVRVDCVERPAQVSVAMRGRRA